MTAEEDGRWVVRMAVVVLSAFAVAACGSGVPADKDQGFVAAVRADGEFVPADPAVEKTLATAARKICALHEDKRSTPLTRGEIEVVQQVFSNDLSRFTELARDQYCSS